MQPVNFVPEIALLDKVMLEFFDKNQHLFVVVDEYGSVTGVVSLEDILEEIIGKEIVDESDRTHNMRALARAARQKGIAVVQEAEKQRQTEKDQAVQEQEPVD